MMNKKTALQIEKLWNEMYQGLNTVKTSAEASGDGIKGMWSVEIKPAESNDGSTFHYINELADITRAFRCSSYIAVREGKVIARIF